MKRKADKRYWLCGLAALCCVGGIFAYWTQELPVHNEFQTAAYDTGIEERFSSPDDWKPGQETNKDVWITNRGTVPVFVKAVLHQEWIRKASSIPLTFQTTDGNAYAAQIIWGENVVLLKTGKKSDIDLGLDTVDRVEDAGGKWLLASDLPDQNGDYLLYYIGVIDPNENSPLIVDAVTMNASIQPEIVRKDTCYDKEREEWVTTQEYNLAENYENARYHLLVTATTVQATPDAAKDIFGTEQDDTEVVRYLAELAAGSDTDAGKTKKLYFEEQNGKMVWNNVRGDDGNWFMSFTDMLPGEQYLDTLDIENGSSKTYEVYLQALPVEQEEMPDELLELIQMKVILGDHVLYEGTASGKAYDNGNLQNVIYLGTYKPGETDQIQTELKLDKNVGLEYRDLLTKTDWKFMVTEVAGSHHRSGNKDGEKSTDPQILQAPQTGDTSGISFYIVMAGSAVVMLAVRKKIKRVCRCGRQG